MPRYTIGENFNLKHSITNQWWSLAFSSTPWSFTIYIHHIHLVQWGQNWGVTQYRVFDTYKSCLQIRISTRPKITLTNFIQSCLCGLWCVWQLNQMLNYVSRCSKSDIKINNNKAYHYIMECIAYLPVPGGIIPSFLKSLSFPSSNRAFHTLDGIIKGCSYRGFFSRWTLDWS